MHAACNNPRCPRLLQVDHVLGRKGSIALATFQMLFLVLTCIGGCCKCGCALRRALHDAACMQGLLTTPIRPSPLAHFNIPPVLALPQPIASLARRPCKPLHATSAVSPTRSGSWCC